MNKTEIRLPLLLSLVLSLGILIGSKIFGGKKYDAGVWGNTEKFRDILSYIDRYYVDSVDLNYLAEAGIRGMLKELDSYTTYIAAADYDYTFSQLKSDFEGVGIVFGVFRDTVKVLSLIENAPAAAAGIKVADRLVGIDEHQIAGVGISSKDVVGLLSGKKNTPVRLTLYRPSTAENIEITVKREKISSLPTVFGYIIRDKVGYISIDEFAETTHTDFRKRLQTLKDSGIESLILDLRNNPGGYLKESVLIADEFLDGKRKIVSTKSKRGRFDRVEWSEKKGFFERGNLVVLINEHTASASELLAGALQDYDRALIVGRNSFGKGLVQLPIRLKDKSVLKLTISRYYMPSGRSLQKSYPAYRNATELLPKNEFLTQNGRIVHEKKGITPDYILAEDTLQYADKRYQKLLQYDVLRDFSHHISEKIPPKLTQSATFFQKNFKLSPYFLSQIESRLIALEIVDTHEKFTEIRPYVETKISAYLAEIFFGRESAKQILHKNDLEIQAALSLIDSTAVLLKKM